jgi:hypothetical protein
LKPLFLVKAAILDGDRIGGNIFVHVGLEIWVYNSYMIYIIVNNTSFSFHWHLFFYFISNNNCRLLTINIVSFIFFHYRESKPPFCLHYEKSSPVNIVYRKINWQKPRLHHLQLRQFRKSWHVNKHSTFFRLVQIIR